MNCGRLKDRQIRTSNREEFNLLQEFRGLRASSPCCSGFPGRVVGHSHRARSLGPDRSSSGWEHIGRSYGRPRSPCKGRLQSAGHSDTAHRCKQTGRCQQSHRYSLRGETRIRSMHRQREDSEASFCSDTIKNDTRGWGQDNKHILLINLVKMYTDVL